MTEHKTIKVSNEADIAKKLDGWAEDGFELLQCVPHQNGYGDRHFILILKRNA